SGERSSNSILFQPMIDRVSLPDGARCRHGLSMTPRVQRCWPTALSRTLCRPADIPLASSNNVRPIYRLIIRQSLKITAPLTTLPRCTQGAKQAQKIYGRRWCTTACYFRNCSKNLQRKEKELSDGDAVEKRSTPIRRPHRGPGDHDRRSGS